VQGESQLEIVASGAAGTSELLLFDLA